MHSKSNTSSQKPVKLLQSDRCTSKTTALGHSLFLQSIRSVRTMPSKEEEETNISHLCIGKFSPLAVYFEGITKDDLLDMGEEDLVEAVRQSTNS